MNRGPLNEAVMRAVLGLVPTRELIDELGRRLAAQEQDQRAAAPPRRSAARRRSASAPRRAHARGRRGRRARAKDDGTDTGAGAPPPRTGEQVSAVDRPLKLVRECAPSGIKFDVPGICSGRAVPPAGEVSVAEAKTILAQVRAYLADHPLPRGRNPPKDAAAYCLARFLGISTGNLKRRLGLRRNLTRGADLQQGGNSSSPVASPTKAQLMAGR